MASRKDRLRPNQYSFELPPHLREGLLALWDRDAAPVSESIRRAIAAYLESKGIAVKGGTSKKTRK
jgi:hypothetical protein